MSALTDRIAAEHEVESLWNTSDHDPRIRCTCEEGGDMTWRGHAAHIAEVTAAVIAADMAKVADQIENTVCNVDRTCHEADAITLRWHLATLAKGGTS